MLETQTKIEQIKLTNPSFTVTIDDSSARRSIEHYAAIWLWIGWTFFYLAFMIASPFLFVYAKPVLSIIVGLMIISAIMPTKRELQPKIGYMIGNWILKKASEYFHVKMIVEDVDKLRECKTAIFAMEPHDVLPLSIFAFNDILGGIPGHRCLGCITSICFSIPLMKHIYTWVNAVSVDRKTITKMLGKGISPVLCPGGVQEVTLLQNDKEIVLYLSKRLGFVKLALQHGVPLVPVFSFGLRNSFSFWIPKGKFFHALGRQFGVLPMAFFGLWGLPLGPSKPCDYGIVVGKPITVPLVAEPSTEQLKHYHAEYIKELTRIFELKKAEFGLEHVSLRIV